MKKIKHVDDKTNDEPIANATNEPIPRVTNEGINKVVNE